MDTQEMKDALVKAGTESFVNFGYIVAYETVLKIIEHGGTIEQLKEFIPQQIANIKVLK